MKIGFTLADLGGCGYYRCILPGLELRKCGHDVRFYRASDRTLLELDTLVIQRAGTEPTVRIAHEFRKFVPNATLLHEFDDNVHEIPASNPCSAIYGNDKPQTKGWEEVTHLVDGCIASTQDLATRYAAFNASITVAPNALADEDVAGFAHVPLSGAQKRLGEVRIGWAGSSTHGADLALVVKPLSRILRRFPNVRLVFFGMDVRALFERSLHGRIEYHPPAAYRDDGPIGTTYEQARANVQLYYHRLAALDLDIAIAPLERTTFNRCKSWVKLLEYGMLGLPTVASKVGPYSQYVAEGGSVLLAEGDREWEARIMELLERADYRGELAQRNRAHIEREHVISKRISAWERAFSPVALVA